MDKLPITELIEDFAREIIEQAMGDSPLGQKIEAFKVITPYFVGGYKAGAIKEEEKDKKATFADMKKTLNGEK